MAGLEPPSPAFAGAFAGAPGAAFPGAARAALPRLGSAGPAVFGTAARPAPPRPGADASLAGALSGLALAPSPPGGPEEAFGFPRGPGMEQVALLDQPSLPPLSPPDVLQAYHTAFWLNVAAYHHQQQQQAQQEYFARQGLYGAPPPGPGGPYGEGGPVLADALGLAPAGAHPPLGSPYGLYGSLDPLQLQHLAAMGMLQHNMGAYGMGGGGGRPRSGERRPSAQSTRRRMEAQDLSELEAQFSSVYDCVGQIAALARDQHGCRFLQSKFDDDGPAAVEAAFGELLDDIVSLMVDPFANYLVQKLLDCCTEEQRTLVLRAVALPPHMRLLEPPQPGAAGDAAAEAPSGPETAADSHEGRPARVVVVHPGPLDAAYDDPALAGLPALVGAALNAHGTRAVQKLVETLAGEEQVGLAVAALAPGVVVLIKDLNGNHVIQRCLQRLGSENVQWIYDAAAQNCVEIATHRHGCCVLQRCIDFATESQKDDLVREVAAQALTLAQDPFGNYVEQYVLSLNMPWAIVAVIDRLTGHFAHLSTQKYSSNVVEKCLKLGEGPLAHCRAAIVRELTASPLLEALLQDPYANYVVQSALALSDGALHADLVDRIRPHMGAIKSSPYGKRILARSHLLHRSLPRSS